MYYIVSLQCNFVIITMGLINEFEFEFISVFPQLSSTVFGKSRGFGWLMHRIFFGCIIELG